MLALQRVFLLIGTALAIAGLQVAYAGAPAMATKPLYLDNFAPPLLLLTMQRDHRLFMEAYDDVSDLDGDGIIDDRYKPGKITYYGYFDSYKCYDYVSANSRFEPKSTTDTKKCSGAWSGDFLNYLTTSRMDAMRKVLYGGKRSTDSATLTVLERAYVPRDFHCWGKDFDPAKDSYSISDYSTLSAPSSGKRHLFVNTTNDTGGGDLTKPPLLRLLTDREEHPWNWTSKEITVCGTELQKADATGEITGLTPTDYTLRVQVCKEGLLEDNCVAYGSGGTLSYKPTGLLHDYGMNDSMKFGLLTGSFGRPTEGGVLRKNIGAFTDEVSSADGTFLKPADSIVKTLDNIAIKTGTTNDGSGFPSWFGNPVAEMMYEGIRYFAGKTDPTSTFTNATTSADVTLSLSKPTSWVSPYTSTNWCAKPFQMVISDVIPTKDSNSMPGSAFNSVTGDLAGFSASTAIDAIWEKEFGVSASKLLFIGEVKNVNSDQLPTGKTVTAFSNIRGLVPEDPNKEGTFYAGAIAAWAKTNDVNSLIKNDQKVDTFSVALSSPLPQIKIPVTIDGKKKYVTLVPYARTLSSNTNSKQGGLYRMFVEKVANISTETNDATINGGRPYYKFRVIFGDAEFSGDFDMDAQVLYIVSLESDGKVKVYTSVHKQGFDKPPQDAFRVANTTPDYAYAVTGGLMHIGYTISGTTEDSARLVIRNAQYKSDTCNWTTGNTATEYTHDLDFWDGVSARSTLDFVEQYYCGNEGTLKDSITYTDSLPFYHSWSYTPSVTTAADYIEHDPLWYAAKWGGFVDGYDNATGRVTNSKKNNQLDSDEWEKVKSDGSLDTTTPRNYFPVTNAGELPATLGKAFEEVAQRDSSASAVAQNSSRLDTTTMIYQARFSPYYWSGELLAFSLDGNGVANTTPAWDAGKKIPAESGRTIATWRESEKKGLSFDYDSTTSTDSLNATEMAFLGSTSNDQLSVLLWLRGSRAGGSRNGVAAALTEDNKKLRTRASTTVLGDIANSDPLFAWAENFGYDAWSDTSGSSTLGLLYTDYRSVKYNREKMLYVGSNDGMLHAFDADTGVEKFAYVPGIILTDSMKGLKSLASRGYVHRYFVDGPLYVGDAAIGSDAGSPWRTVLVGALGAGGKGVYALDVSTPGAFSSTSVLWEFTHPELGNVIGQPLISRLNDGNWYAIVPNGLGSSTCDANGYNKNACKNSTLDFQNARLFLIKLLPSNLSSSGWVASSDYRVISATSNTTDATGAKANGLTAVTGLDSDGDRKIDFVYAGDLQGHIWKFDLSNSNADQWAVAFKAGSNPAPLFTGTVSSNAQPFTAPVELFQHPSVGGSYCVVAGSGRYLYASDVTDTKTQSLYGIIDSGGNTANYTRADLQQQSILEEKNITIDGYSQNIRITSNTAVPNSKKGWFLDLLKGGTTQEGERNVVTPVISTGKAIFTTIIPSSDQCVAGGSSWLMELEPCSGSRLNFSPFDINNDLSFNSKDYVTASDGTKVPASGLQPGKCVGADCTSGTNKLCQNPALIKAGAIEYKIFSCTDGSVQTVKNKGSQPFPRSSWRQLR